MRNCTKSIFKGSNKCQRAFGCNSKAKICIYNVLVSHSVGTFECTQRSALNPSLFNLTHIINALISLYIHLHLHTHISSTHSQTFISHTVFFCKDWYTATSFKIISEYHSTSSKPCIWAHTFQMTNHFEKFAPSYL